MAKGSPWSATTETTTTVMGAVSTAKYKEATPAPEDRPAQKTPAL